MADRHQLNPKGAAAASACVTVWVCVCCPTASNRVATLPAESCDAASCFLFCGSTQTILVLVAHVVSFVVPFVVVVVAAAD